MTKSLQSLTELLKQARELIQLPENWTQGKSARDLQGEPVMPGSSTAVCWCSMGAINKIAPTQHTYNVALGYLGIAAQELDPDSSGVVWYFNDRHEHNQVLALFDKAIENANNS